ncbi:unnamed protein product [Linum trigynum]|uniref:Uncharacterized protein n=1 Tax=Linum trigynum TaxID=586398 RepID=A0AAV2D8V0_9ROSI
MWRSGRCSEAVDNAVTEAGVDLMEGNELWQSKGRVTSRLLVEVEAHSSSLGRSGGKSGFAVAVSPIDF